jgi:basic membrane lipoprotein Med (substrate-binding protein (PBP1-ABC) superfamily)
MGLGQPHPKLSGQFSGQCACSRDVLRRYVRRVKIKFVVAVGAAAAVIATVLAAWALWPRPAAGPPASGRTYLDVSACLLTGPSGVVPGTASAPVWAAMQSASQATHVMVSYLPDTGRADITPMLNTLVERQCGVIVASGDAAAAVVRAARANPHQSFLLVDTPGSSAAAPPNTVVVPAADAPGRIDQALRALAAHAPPTGS